MCSLALIQKARLLLLLSRGVQGGAKGGKDPQKGELTTHESTSCDIVVLPSELVLQQQQKKKLTPVFWKGHIWDWMRLCEGRGSCVSCVHRWNATQHPSLLSVVLWMSNPEALTPTALSIPPLYAPYPTWPSSLKQPWPTWLTEPPAWGFCAPNETYNNVTSNVKARVISACVCSRVWCMVLKGVEYLV